MYHSRMCPLKQQGMINMYEVRAQKSTVNEDLDQIKIDILVYCIWWKDYILHNGTTCLMQTLKKQSVTESWGQSKEASSEEPQHNMSDADTEAVEND